MCLYAVETLSQLRTAYYFVVCLRKAYDLFLALRTTYGIPTKQHYRRFHLPKDEKIQFVACTGTLSLVIISLCLLAGFQFYITTIYV